jgi:hypothetical protein
MARRIDAADPNHMIMTGLISTSWAGFDDDKRDSIYRDAPIDYVTVHEYEEPLNTEAQTDEVWRAINRYRKPVIIEEYGAASAAGAQHYYDARLAPANRDFEATGILYWGVSSSADRGITDGRWSPQALGAYDWFVGFWQTWAQRLVAEQSSGGGGGTCVALEPGQSLGRDVVKMSCDGRTSLVMQGDGNLVLYRNGVGPLWASCTGDASTYGVYMQGDGNLVVYAPGGARFDSHTSGHANARLVFEGNRIAIRTPTNALVWSSQTWCR